MASLVCKIMGAVFVILAIWGFIAKDSVLIFHVNTAHNLVHLATGLVALACGFAGEQPARIFCIAFGLVYGLVTILGFLNVQFIVDLLHLNTADNWLHAVITAVFLIAGLASKPALSTTTRAT
jgi:hypothetical protein